MNFIDHETYGVEYEHINRTLLDEDVTNISLLIYKGEVGAIDSKIKSCHSYYIIKFTLTPYTFQ